MEKPELIAQENVPLIRFVDLLPSEETDATDPQNPITTAGWEVTFVRATP